MVNTCSANNCKNRTRKGCNTSFFRFPLDVELFKEWTSAVGKDNWEPTRNSRLCEDHFSADCFIIRSSGTRGLKRSAVPSIFYQIKKNEKWNSFSFKELANRRNFKNETNSDSMCLPPNGELNEILDPTYCDDELRLKKESGNQREFEDATNVVIPNVTSLTPNVILKEGIELNCSDGTADTMSLNSTSPQATNLNCSSSSTLLDDSNEIATNDKKRKKRTSTSTNEKKSFILKVKPLETLCSSNESKRPSCNISEHSRLRKENLLLSRKVKRYEIRHCERRKAFKRLRSRLKTCTNALESVRKKIIPLKKKAKMSERQSSAFYQFKNVCREIFKPVISEILVRHALHYYSDGTMKKSFNNDIRTFCLTLFLYSQNSYAYLCNFIQLPQLRTCSNWVKEMDCQPDILKDAFMRLLKKKEDLKEPNPISSTEDAESHSAITQILDSSHIDNNCLSSADEDALSLHSDDVLIESLTEEQTSEVCFEKALMDDLTTAPSARKLEDDSEGCYSMQEISQETEK